MEVSSGAHGILQPGRIDRPSHFLFWFFRFRDFAVESFD